MIWPGVGTFLGAAGCFRLRSGRIVEEILNSTNPLHRTLALDRNFSRFAIPKLLNNVTLLGDMCSWRPPAPAFFPRVGSVGLYFCHRVRRGERNGGREFLGAITLAQPSVVVLFYGFADFHSLSLTQRMLFYFSRLSSLSLSLYYLLSLTLLLLYNQTVLRYYFSIEARARAREREREREREMTVAINTRMSAQESA